MRLLVAGAVIFGVSGCSSFEGYFSAILTRAGVPQREAACRADRFDKRLADKPLGPLVSAIVDYDRTQTLTLIEIEQKVSAIGDPEIDAAYDAATADCAVVG